MFLPVTFFLSQLSYYYCYSFPFGSPPQQRTGADFRFTSTGAHFHRCTLPQAHTFDSPPQSHTFDSPPQAHTFDSLPQAHTSTGAHFRFTSTLEQAQTQTNTHTHTHSRVHFPTFLSTIKNIPHHLLASNQKYQRAGNSPPLWKKISSDIIQLRAT
jgi:hypothetical protein